MIIRTSFFALALLLAVPHSADAGERERSGTYTTGSGKSGSWSGERSGSRGEGVTRNQSWTNSQGETKNRSATTTYDKESGAYNKTVTGANGETRTHTGTAQDGKVSGSYETSTGKSGTYEGSVRKNEDGSWTREGSATNQDGETKSRSVTGWFDRESGTGGRTIANGQGRSRTGSYSIERD